MKELFTLITSLTFLQATIYCFIFVLNRKRNSSLILLGIYLFTIVGPGLHFILEIFDIKAVYGFPTNFSFLSPPIFYLYTRSILGVLRKKDYWHLVLGIIEFVLFTILFLFPSELGKPFYENILLPNKVFVYVVLIPIYSVSYLIASIVLLRKYKSEVKNFYSSYEESRLNWIYITNSISIFLYVLDTTATFILIKHGAEINTYMVITIAIAFIVYWISIYGLNQKNLLLEIDTEKPVPIEKEPSTVEIKDTLFQNEIQNEEYQEKYSKIISFVSETKIYKDKEINLFSVSDLVQMSYRDVSRLINNYGNKNFNQFINEFRIEEAKKLIIEDNLNKYNLSGIAEEVGFNSRSTFFAAFKAITGMTPIEFKNAQKNDSDRI